MWKVLKEHTHVFTHNFLKYSTDLISLESPKVSAFQNLLRIENRLNIKKGMSKNVQDHFELLSIPLTYMALQPL